ncbi:MAG: hypothetical protein SFU25_09170 [Candidatus Caenarcaniphilales bacterium]|nr:hypothetical protein [Candidatus Caenarcaniphilales bacterium]
MKKTFLFSLALLFAIQPLVASSQSMSNSQFNVNGDPIPETRRSYKIQRPQNQSAQAANNVVTKDDSKEAKGLFGRFKKKNKQEAKTGL